MRKAHQFGNFHKYYSFHPSDTRMRLFKEEYITKLWKAQHCPSQFTILDIGCNEGDLTIALQTFVKEVLPTTVTVKVIGIDIDSELIELANQKYKDCVNSNFYTLDFMNGYDNTDSNIHNSNKINSASSANSNDSNANTTKTSSTDSDNDNTDCHTASNASINSSERQKSNNECSSNSELISSEQSIQLHQEFSLVCLFSITMWVHLNHGDDGLTEFLRRASNLLIANGGLLIEPQPWRCYKNAEKRCRKIGLPKPKHIETITVRELETGIVEIMETQLQFKHHWYLGKENWNRPIFIFHKEENNYW